MRLFINKIFKPPKIIVHVIDTIYRNKPNLDINASFKNSNGVTTVAGATVNAFIIKSWAKSPQRDIATNKYRSSLLGNSK